MLITLSSMFLSFSTLLPLSFQYIFFHAARTSLWIYLTWGITFCVLFLVSGNINVCVYENVMKMYLSQAQQNRSLISPCSPTAKRNNTCSHLDSQRFRTCSACLSFLFFLDQLKYNTDNILCKGLQGNSGH